MKKPVVLQPRLSGFWLLAGITFSAVSQQSALSPQHESNKNLSTITSQRLTPTVCNSQNTVVLKDDSKTTIDGRASNWKHGDTICIASHPSGINRALMITNLQGSAAAPITIINAGGQVVFNGDGYTDMAIIVKNSQFLRITGSGSDHHQYGFKIDGQNRQIRKGVGFYQRSSDIELDHIEVGYVTSSAMGLTTYSNCSDGSVPARYKNTNDSGPYYPGDNGPYYDAYGKELVLVDDPADYYNNFMHDFNGDDMVNALDASSTADQQFNNAIYHDNYIHHTGSEGMYIGSNAGFRLYKVTNDPDPHFYPGSAMGGNERRICQYFADAARTTQIANGAYNEPISGQINGLTIYNSRLEYIGWDAINVKSSAINCQIFDNEITHFATENYNKDQINAIDLQPNTQCDIYRNKIIDGNGVGIHSAGLGGVIAHNLIVDVGKGYCDCDGDGSMDRSPGREFGISVGINTDQSNHFMVDENDQVIPWTSVFAGHRFDIVNNTIINPVEQAIRFNLELETHAIVNNIIDNLGIDADTSVTINQQNVMADDSFFVAPALGDYRLAATATPVINNGSDTVSLLAIDSALATIDLAKTSGPLQGAYDIGAYEYTSLTVTNAGTGDGTVTSDPAGIQCGSVCGYSFADTTTVLLTAVPSSESHFVGWTGCDTVINSQCWVMGYRQVTATFAANQLTITAIAAEHGNISEAGEVVVANGDDKTFYFTPDSFYRVAKVVVDDVDMGAITQYTFNQVTAGHWLKVWFEIDPALSKLIHLGLDEQTGNTASNQGSLYQVQGNLLTQGNWTTGGRHNGALVLDGSNWINLGQPSELDFTPTEQDYSLSVWFKTSNYGALLAKVVKSTSNVQFYMFISSDGKLYARSGSNSNLVTLVPVNDGQWHLATLVNDSAIDKFTLYVDGVAIGSKNVGTNTSNGMDVLIGARHNGTNSKFGFPFTGSIDDVQIFNRALTAEEVAAMFVF